MAKTKKDPTTTKTADVAAAATKDADKLVEVAEKTVENTDVVEPVVEDVVETVEKPETVPAETASNTAKKTNKTKAPRKPRKPKAEKETKKETKKEPKKETKKTAVYGIVKLNGPTPIYRGPGVYPFAKINGVVQPLEDADENGYTKVQCVISGSGLCTGYVKL